MCKKNGTSINLFFSGCHGCRLQDDVAGSIVVGECSAAMILIISFSTGLNGRRFADDIFK